MLPAICRTGRCRLRLTPGDHHRDWLPIAWDDAVDWLPMLHEEGRLRVPAAQRDELMAARYALPALPPITLPSELRYQETGGNPQPRLSVRPSERQLRQERVRGRLSFDYDGIEVAFGQPGRGIVQPKERRVIMRNVAAERGARLRLDELGWRPAPPEYGYGYGDDDDGLGIEPPTPRLPEVARALVAAGWHVDAEGKPYRQAGSFEFRVTSGIDWFELHGELEFGDATAALPELLAAARRREQWVTLGDGSFGLLPEEWLARYGARSGRGPVPGAAARRKSP